ncbi:hypothetical protein GBA52_021720 [Prunus armeniaca]|nr:hypothetical protein GBA52_021720 [Prunus armeniaca]
MEVHQLWKVTDGYQLALKIETQLTRRATKKFVDVRNFYPLPRVNVHLPQVTPIKMRKLKN